MKKFTSIIIALAMLCAMMVTMIPTASAAWDGTSASAALVGSGTEFDPYVISNENDLAFVAKQVNDGVTNFAGEYFKLTVDLDLGGQTWTPIGHSKPNFFSGTFDGDGHTVTGLVATTVADNTNSLYGGLFGRVDNGIIKNVTVEGAKIKSLKYAGAIVGNLTTKDTTLPAEVINCHAINCEVYGIQVGGVVGRSSTTGAAKGLLKITGCSANNITIGTISTDDFATADNGNHFVGGIVGGIGSTVVSGCNAQNITVNAHGTSFAPVGGIVGVLGADKASGDVVNCYAIGINLTVSAESNPEKTSLGGLIGKAAHVGVAFGDPNTEYNIFNCFVADVTLSNGTSNGRDGMIAGWVNDTIYFNDIYYVPSGNIPAYGYDTYYAEWPFVAVNAASEVKAADLNSGNSTTVWADDIVLGHPVIDVDALLANQPTFVDYFVEHAEATTEPETTEAPAVTEPEATEPEATEPEATEPEATEPEATEPEATEAPVVTDAPAQGTEAPKEEKGCGGMIAGGVIIVALLGTAVVLKKRD